MKIVIDTSSLISFVRYYLPFDNNSILFNFIKKKIQQKEIIIIDKVFQEYKGFVSSYKTSDKLEESGLDISLLKYKTEDLDVTQYYKNFAEKIDSDFCDSDVKKTKEINDSEYQKEKKRFRDGADATQIILCLKFMDEQMLKEEVILITEETVKRNDNKLFHKIPTICNKLNIPTFTLPKFFEKHFNFSIEKIEIKNEKI